MKRNIKIAPVPAYGRVDNGAMVYGMGRTIACFSSQAKWDEYNTSTSYVAGDSPAFRAGVYWEDICELARVVVKRLQGAAVLPSIKGLCLYSDTVKPFKHIYDIELDKESFPKGAQFSPNGYYVVWYPHMGNSRNTNLEQLVDWFIKTFNFKLTPNGLTSYFGDWVYSDFYGILYAEDQPRRWYIEMFNSGLSTSGTWTHTNGTGTYTCKKGVWDRLP
jgi:hypothetical protein